MAWQPKRFPSLLSPFVLGDHNVLLDECRRRGVDRSHRLRAAYIHTLSRLFAPLRWIENTYYREQVSTTPIEHPPIFVLGHWRSGTTHLHNLFTQDPQFAYISNLHTATASAFFSFARFLHPLANWISPTIRRPMDNVTMTAVTPQEEEFALCGLSPYAMYFHWLYPRSTVEYVRKYVLFEGVSPAVVSEWKRTYHYVLQQATRYHQGKRLVLKNPPNTGRLSVLRALYPDAKFVFIHRDPYTVMQSTRKLYEVILGGFQLQDISAAEIDEIILTVYEEMMRRYLRDRADIPANQLCEVSFADLETDAMGVMASIYQQLELPGWGAAEPLVSEYLAGQAGYQKNRFADDEALIEMVNARWGFAFEAFGYEKAGEFSPDIQSERQDAARDGRRR